MEMIGGNSASYLARTPSIPLFCTLFVGVEAEGLLDYQGRAGITSIVRWSLRPVIFCVDRGFADCPQFSLQILTANFSRKFIGLVSPAFQAHSQKNSSPRFTPQIVSIPLQFQMC